MIRRRDQDEAQPMSDEEIVVRLGTLSTKLGRHTGAAIAQANRRRRIVERAWPEDCPQKTLAMGQVKEWLDGRKTQAQHEFMEGFRALMLENT